MAKIKARQINSHLILTRVPFSPLVIVILVLEGFWVVILIEPPSELNCFLVTTPLAVVDITVTDELLDDRFLKILEVADTVSTSFSVSPSLVRTAVGVVVMTVLSLLVSTATGVEEARGIDSVLGVSDFLSPIKTVGVSLTSSLVGRVEPAVSMYSVAPSVSMYSVVLSISM